MRRVPHFRGNIEFLRGRFMFGFDRRVALVTGGGGGIGLALAESLLARGARVGVIDTKPRPSAYDEAGDGVRYHQIDLRDAAAVVVAANDVAEAFGGLNYLANVAGVLWFDRDRSALDIDLDVWDEVLRINLRGVVHAVRAATPHMRATEGPRAMVHFSTISCLRGDTTPQDAYQASKAAVAALSRSLAMQLAREGIRSNAIYPGSVLTPLQARWEGNDEILEAIGSIVPLGRIGQPSDLANAALFLLSDAASYITGVDLAVDGGLMAKPPA
jgi:3-oxoacyl-[acyl-carrier protein] reductase